MIQFLAQYWQASRRLQKGLKASVFAIIFVFAIFALPRFSSASTVIYTSFNGSTLNDDGSFTYAGGDNAMNFSISGVGSSGFGGRSNFFQGVYDVGYNLTGIYSGSLCFTSSTCSPTATFTATFSGNTGSFSVFNGVFLQNTRILSITPVNGQVVSSSTATTSLSTTVYLNDSDFYQDFLGNIKPITIDYYVDGINLVDQSSLPNNYSVLNGLQAYHYSTTTYHSGETTINLVASTSLFSVGKRVSTVNISSSRPYLTFFNQPYSVVSSSTSWVLGGKTGFDLIQEDLAVGRGRVTASTTIDMSVCNFFSGSFGFNDCWNALITPDVHAMASDLSTINQNLKSSFPYSYVYDFISILSTTTVGTLTVLDVHVPSGVPGTGSHLRLDFNLSLIHI